METPNNTKAAAQQQRLDALHIPTTGVPPGVDPAAWASIHVPADNPQTPGRIALGPYGGGRGLGGSELFRDVSKGLWPRAEL